MSERCFPLGHRLVPTLALATLSAVAVLGAAAPARAAVIVGYEIRGGGCLNPSCAVSFDWSDGNRTVTIGKDFLRTEETEEDETGGTDGEGQTGNRGGRDGRIGPPMGGGHDGEDDHVEEFGRLPPINVFLTLANSGGTDTYRVDESITNGTGADWLGFMVALRRNESGLASVLDDPAATSDPFDEIVVSGEHGAQSPLIMAQFSFVDPLAIVPSGTTFDLGYGLAFQDCVAGVSCSDSLAGGQDGFEGYVVNLQQFPLVTPEDHDVPVPATAALLLPGLFGVGLLRRRRT